MKKISKKISMLLLASLGICSLHAEENPSAKFSILQFNIWNEARGINGGFESIVNEIIKSEADFITLSEVRNYSENFTQKLCEEIEKKSGKRFYSFRSDDSGLLSSHPIAKHQTIFALSNDRGSIYKAITQIAGHRVALYTAHLDYTHYPCYYPRGYNGENWQKLDKPVTDTCAIRKMNLASKRDEQIQAFINDANREKELGSLIFLGGDFNEPSHLDWGSNMKDLFDHNGVVYQWDQSKALSDNEFVDSYREVWPNAKTHPGITYPSDNPDQSVNSLTWAPDADERDRIDFIYHGPHKDLQATQAKLVGPRGTISHNQRVENPGYDVIVSPLGVWPSDHKAILIEYTLDNADIHADDIDPLTSEEKKEIEEAEKNKVIEPSSAKEKICYRIKNATTGQYAARDEWKTPIQLISADEANKDAGAYWWFEDGIEIDQKFIIRNFATLDNLNLFALDNNFKNNDGTEWNISKVDGKEYCKIGWGNNEDYDWTATSEGIFNKKDAGESDLDLWVLEKVEPEEIPLPYIKVSDSQEKHYFIMINRQKDQLVATAPTSSQKAAILDDYHSNSLNQLWYFESVPNQSQDFYIKNAAYPDLYFTGVGNFSFGTEKTVWNLQISEADNTAIKNVEKPEIKKYFVFRKKGEKQCLSYTKYQQGAELIFWDGNNTNWCDTWALVEVPITTGIQELEYPEFNDHIYNVSGQRTYQSAPHNVYIKNGRKYLTR